MKWASAPCRQGQYWNLVSLGNLDAAEVAADKTRTVPDADHRIIFERDVSPCLVLLPDAPRFTIVAANDAYLDLARTTRADCVGCGLTEGAARAPYLLAESRAETVRSSLAQAVAERSATRLVLGSGSSPDADPPASSTTPRDSLWAVVNAPVSSQSGELRYLLHRVEPMVAAISPSVEREQRLSRELEERSRDLHNALGELEAFSYSVSHDLRAPLRAIDGFAQALSQDYAATLDAGAQHYLDRVRAGAQRMSELIDGTLELSHIHRDPLHLSKIDVSALCQRIVQGLTKSHPERNVEVDVKPGLWLYADGHMLRVLLEKLLDNAWKFTSKRSAAHVRVGCDNTASDRPTLFVADDGVGFDMAHASRLFAPFQRLHKASEFAGTGIGLAVAHRIVSRHGGRIWAEAELGKGAKFRFCLGAGDE
jgi:signal transduction histidine kinase